VNEPAGLVGIRRARCAVSARRWPPQRRHAPERSRPRRLRWYAADGSLEIALQPGEPTDPVRRANWLPTPVGEPFTVIYRLYGPGEDAQAGTW
jgi:hypothetical protein